MAPTAKATPASLEHVWGALVKLIDELTRLAKIAADQLEAEQGGRKL